VPRPATEKIGTVRAVQRIAFGAADQVIVAEPAFNAEEPVGFGRAVEGQRLARRGPAEIDKKLGPAGYEAIGRRDIVATPAKIEVFNILQV